MQRGGHRSPTVALTYQHAAEERGRIIAAGIDAALGASSESGYGTRLARTANDALPLRPADDDDNAG